MSQSVLVTIPDELVEDFINHLGRMKPEKAKHITITLIDDISHEEKIQKARDMLEYYREPDIEDTMQIWNLPENAFDSDRYK